MVVLLIAGFFGGTRGYIITYFYSLLQNHFYTNLGAGNGQRNEANPV